MGYKGWARITLQVERRRIRQKTSTIPVALTKLPSVGSSPGMPRCERFCTIFHGQKGSFATTCPYHLASRRDREERSVMWCP